MGKENGPTSILVLDDDPVLRRTTVRMLTRGGYDVHDAASAEEAREVVDAVDGPIDLLLCDLELDGLKGREAAIMLQARRPEMRVLFMSGHDGADFREQLEASEPVFLAKPFDGKTLLAAVERALDAGSS